MVIKVKETKKDKNDDYVRPEAHRGRTREGQLRGKKFIKVN